jgi:glycosyltransferase involved in cell wall biosynthesis
MNFQISVIIPTYNRADLVVRALESVLAQTYPAYEVIIVDDGSTDGTADALRPYVERGRKEGLAVRYIYQENQRQSAARNRGLEETKGGWVAFLDSDDVWHPEKLEHQVQAVAKFWPRSAACFTDALYVNHPVVKSTVFKRAGKSYECTLGLVESPSQLVAKGNHGLTVQALVASSELARQLGGFDRNLFLHEDTDFIFRLALETNFCYVNLPLVDIDRTPNRSIGMVELLDKDELRLQQRQFMYEKWLRLTQGRENGAHRLVVGHLCSIHSEWANCYLTSGDYAKARQAMSKTLGYRLAARTGWKWFLTMLAPSFARKIVLERAKSQAGKNTAGSW